MRDIKYRYLFGVDGEQETYFTKIFEFGQIEGGWVQEELADNPLLINYAVLGKDQYTGLKDRLGKEIYEGDIVKWRGDMDNAEMEEKYGPEEDDCGNWPDDPDEWIFEWPTDVVTMNRFPVFWLKNEEFGYEGEELISTNGVEVVGNIHENPELLEPAK